MKVIYFSLLLLFGCSRIPNAQQSDIDPFWKNGKQFYDKQKLNLGVILAVAKNGNVIGKDRYSSDGGVTWKKMANKPDNAFYYVVDNTTGDVLATEGLHETTLPFQQWRSKDFGATWTKEVVTLHKDRNGWLSSRSACESGITLQHGKYKGRLLAASRVFVDYDNKNNYDYHYSNAVYSDDGGKTWNPSTPFPFVGTGEAALVELSNGVIYYNSRCHTRIGNRLIAYSYDGGHTWRDFRECDYLPDGPPAFYGCKGGLTKLPVADHDILLFSMNDTPDNKDTSRHNTKGRVNLTVWASFDGGKTWPVKRLLHNEGGYSSLSVGVKGTPSEGMIYATCIDGSFSRFNLAWLTNGRNWKEFLKP